MCIAKVRFLSNYASLHKIINSHKYNITNIKTAYYALKQAYNKLCEMFKTVNPCPPNWRLPSQEEYQQLHNSGSSWVEANAGRGNIIPGRFYGYAHTFCKLPNNMEGCVFFPVSGYRDSNGNGALLIPETSGYYWSSTQTSSTVGYALSISSTSSSPARSISKASGFVVRCVR